MDGGVVNPKYIFLKTFECHKLTEQTERVVTPKYSIMIKGECAQIPLHPKNEQDEAKQSCVWKVFQICNFLRSSKWVNTAILLNGSMPCSMHVLTQYIVSNWLRISMWRASRDLNIQSQIVLSTQTAKQNYFFLENLVIHLQDGKRRLIVMTKLKDFWNWSPCMDWIHHHKGLVNSPYNNKIQYTTWWMSFHFYTILWSNLGSWVNQILLINKHVQLNGNQITRPNELYSRGLGIGCWIQTDKIADYGYMFDWHFQNEPIVKYGEVLHYC